MSQSNLWSNTMINKELINRLIKDVENTGTPKLGLMRHFTKPCGSPSCIAGFIASYSSPTGSGIAADINDIWKTLGMSHGNAMEVMTPEFRYANYQIEDPSKDGHITKAMVVKFLKNLLKEKDPAACWWLASEGVVL